MLEVRLTAVRVDLPTNTPVVLLQEIGGSRSLPIFIGAPEATAIAYALQHVAVPRPMTHDLMKDLLDTVGLQVRRVVVTEVRDATYFAEIHLQQADRLFQLSARPSDAIALAARTGSPLFVEDELMEAAGIVIEDDDEEEGDSDTPEELVGQFLEFLDKLRPEDFSG
jgi:bifunctional DNase/RNase